MPSNVINFLAYFKRFQDNSIQRTKPRKERTRQKAPLEVNVELEQPLNKANSNQEKEQPNGTVMIANPKKRKKLTAKQKRKRKRKRKAALEGSTSCMAIALIDFMEWV